jgi:hypothetical protein
MIVGTWDIGNPVQVPADTKRMSRLTFPIAEQVVKLTIYLDGLGPSALDCPIRPIMYTLDGSLVEYGCEEIIPAGQEPGWVILQFEREGKGGAALPAKGDYYIGLHTSDSTCVRVYEKDPDPPGGVQDFNFYWKGAELALGATTFLSGRMSMYAETCPLWRMPQLVDDIYIARLPFREAQAEFGKWQPKPKSARTAKLAWHGTRIDPERGSFCVSNWGSEFDDLIGQRVRITLNHQGARGARVYAFCHNAATLTKGEVSVTRRLFAALTELGHDEVHCIVEPLFVRPELIEPEAEEVLPPEELDQTPPTAPGELTATTIDSTEIDLGWTSSTDTGTGVAGYRIERRELS